MFAFARRRPSDGAAASAAWRGTIRGISVVPSRRIAEWRPARRRASAETAPRYVLRDRDAVYGGAFSRRVQTMGIHQVKTAPRSPWQNRYVERLIGTLRRECLDHVVVLNEPHLRRLLRDYLLVLPQCQDPPLPGEGRSGAKTGGAP